MSDANYTLALEEARRSFDTQQGVIDGLLSRSVNLLGIAGLVATFFGAFTTDQSPTGWTAIHEKALGTAAGAAAEVVVAIIAPPSWVLTALAILAFLLAVVQRATCWRMYGLYTFALVIYIAAPDAVAFEAEERRFQILAGIALLLIGLAILHAIGDRLARRYPQPELASDAQRA